MSMSLQLRDVSFPEVIEFNYDELKAEISARAELYRGLTYTDDQVKEAKKDLAGLRKFTKALNDERIRIKRELMRPYDVFEKRINELCGIVNDVACGIDAQVKNAEERRRADKQDEIVKLWDELPDKPEWLVLTMIFDKKWLNASASLKAIGEAMTARVEQINSDMRMLVNLPEFGFEASTIYKESLDVNAAIAEAQRMSEMARAKAEAERLEAERLAAEAAEEIQEDVVVDVVLEEVRSEVRAEAERLKAEAEAEAAAEAAAEAEAAVGHEIKRVWLAFKAFLAADDARALKALFEARNVEYERI